MLINKVIFIYFGLSLVSSTTAALTAQTAKTIHGTNPYIELNGLQATDLSSLLSIQIGGDVYTSNALGEIKDKSGNSVDILSLPSDIGFTGVSTITYADGEPKELSSIISDDSRKDNDGDQNFTIKGKVTVTWKDSGGNTIDPTSSPSPCLSPYTLTLTTSDNPSIATEYGDPRLTTYGDSSVVYKFSSPTGSASICYVTPDMTYAFTEYNPNDANVWDTTKGFKLQSESNYSKNFPTTGLNGAYFDLNISGVSELLDWSAEIDTPIIIATIRQITTTQVRVTLTGPVANGTVDGATADAFSPTQIVLKGKRGNTPVVHYGFIITKWFIAREGVGALPTIQEAWCNNLTSSGNQYRLPHVHELSNNRSSWNTLVRSINGGLLDEWGFLTVYNSDIQGSIWTQDMDEDNNTKQYYLSISAGALSSLDPNNEGTDNNLYSICISN